MMSKKLVNAMLTLAIVCSAVFAAPVADAGDAASRTTYYMENETYDSFDGSGWNMDGYTFNSNLGTDTGYGLREVSGSKTLTFKKENGSLIYTLPDNTAISEGIFCFDSDIFLGGSPGIVGGHIYFKDSNGNAVCTLDVNYANTEGENVEKVQTWLTNGTDKDCLGIVTAINHYQKPTLYKFTIKTEIDLDNDTATMVYTANNRNSTAEVTDTMEIKIAEAADIKTIEFKSDWATYSSYLSLDNTTLYSYETKEDWQFDPIPLTDYADSKLRFDISYVQNETGVTATATTEKKVSEFINEFAPDSTVLSGTGEVSFGIIITDIKLNQGISRVYIVNENSPVSLSSGDFDPDAEIDEAEYIEIGDFGFDVMD